MSNWKVIGAGLALLVAVPVGCSVLGGLTSVASAPGRVVQKTMKTENIVSNYEYFHAASSNFVAKGAQVQQFKSLLKDETDKSEAARLRIDLAGVQQSCRDLAAEYNGRSAMVNRSIFKGTTTPVQLNAAICE